MVLLRCKLDESLCLLAMCCSSFVPVSRGSTHRSELHPMGNPDFPGVQLANLLGSRCLYYLRVKLFLFLVLYVIG